MTPLLVVSACPTGRAENIAHNLNSQLFISVKTVFMFQVNPRGIVTSTVVKY